MQKEETECDMAFSLFCRSGAKSLVIFVTGKTTIEATKVVEGVWKNSLSAEEIETILNFYMQSGLCYEKMGFFDKAIMKMAAKIMSGKNEKLPKKAFRKR